MKHDREATQTSGFPFKFVVFAVGCLSLTDVKVLCKFYP